MIINQEPAEMGLWGSCCSGTTFTFLPYELLILTRVMSGEENEGFDRKKLIKGLKSFSPL
jgi:hypothetical protein